MTDITLEQRARELLAAEHEREGLTYMVDGLMHPDAEFTPATNRTLRAITAALRLPAGADWQPIETAPKDEWVLISDRAGNVYAAHKQFGYWHAWFDYREDLTIDSPTHWQPLPAAPRLETGEGV